MKSKNRTQPAADAAAAPSKSLSIGNAAPPRGRFVDVLRANQRWLKLSAVFAGLWILELFWMQALTLIPPNATGPRYPYFAAAFRLVMDAVFCVGLTFILPRWCLTVIAPVVTACSLGLIIYAKYFMQPFSIFTLIYQSNEGWLVKEYVWALIPWGIASGLILLLAGQWWVLFAARRPRFTWRQIGGLWLTFLAVYGALFFVADQIDPLRKLLTKRGVARTGMIRGYMDTWIGELYYLTDDAILKRALERRQDASDKLSPQEADIPIGDHVVVMQCESLDFNLLDHSENGKVLTPFLNELKKTSLFYRIETMHSQGTADADFAAVCGYPPSADVITYNIPNYPYENTLPQMLRKFGFHTQALHGYWGSFYNRRFAFQKCGFDDILFQEELNRKYGLPISNLGVLDRDVLNQSAKLLNQTPGRVFQFIITLSTHGPFNSIAESDREVFTKHPTLSQNYLNSIRYLDHCLEDWYGKLPEGTTVMIYGDQAADVNEGDFHADRDAVTHKEYAPCLIFKKGVDFSQLQKTRDLPQAFNGELGLIDLVWYFRGQIEKSFTPAPQPADSATLELGNVGLQYRAAVADAQLQVP